MAPSHATLHRRCHLHLHAGKGGGTNKAALQSSRSILCEYSMGRVVYIGPPVTSSPRLTSMPSQRSLPSFKDFIESTMVSQVDANFSSRQSSLRDSQTALLVTPDTSLDASDRVIDTFPLRSLSSTGAVVPSNASCLNNSRPASTTPQSLNNTMFLANIALGSHDSSFHLNSSRGSLSTSRPPSSAESLGRLAPMQSHSYAETVRPSLSHESLGVTRHRLSSSSSSSSSSFSCEDENDDDYQHPAARKQRVALPPINVEEPTIQLSKKRYADSKAANRPQGRPFSDKMVVSLNVAESLDGILSSYLSSRPEHNRLLETQFVEFDVLPPRGNGQYFAQVNSNRYRIDHKHIYDGIKQLFDLEDFFFVQLIRPSSSQTNSAYRSVSSLPIQKFVTIPITETNKHDMTCKFIKQNVAFPRYKCHMRLFLVKGRCTSSTWLYTNDVIMKQEFTQVSRGKLTIPAHVEIKGPTSFMRWVVERRLDKKHARAKQVP